MELANEGTPSSHEFTHLSKSFILDHKDEAGLAAQFLRSAAYSGAEAPLRGLAQVVDQSAGTHADDTVKSAFKAAGVEPVKPAEFGTSPWVAQQVGSAVGMMLPYMTLRAGVNYGAGRIFGASAVEAGTQSLTKTALREAALSGTTGVLYGALLSPTDENNVGKSSFYTDRLRGSLENGASFAALSFASPYIGHGLKSAALAVEGSALPAILKTPVESALKFPVVTGMLSGVPSGVLMAEVNALKSGKLLPSALAVKESVGSMVTVGGAMGLAQWALEKAAASSDDRSDAEQRAAAEAKERAAAEAKAKAAAEKAAQDNTTPGERMSPQSARSAAGDRAAINYLDDGSDLFNRNAGDKLRQGFVNGLSGDASDRVAKGSAGADASAWLKSDFESTVDGSKIAYKMRQGDASQPVRVYSGGLALNDGFEAFYAAGPPSKGSEYFMWTRGNYPSEWKVTPKTLDADARDLATMVTKAAEQSESGKVELVLHSFGTTVAQRMVQMHDDPQMANALKHVSHIWMIDPTTHFDGMEKIVGPEMEQMGNGSKQFVGALDLMDKTEAAREAAVDLGYVMPKETIRYWFGDKTADNMAALNQAYQGKVVWGVQRDALMGLASKIAVEAQRKDLQEPWEPSFEKFRGQALDRLSKNAVDPGWQEATLRRLGDLFKLEMKADDFSYLKEHNIPVDMFHSTHDQVLNWANSRSLLNLMKIPSPDQMPAAGTLLTNADGLFRSHFIDADHYWPQKHPEQLREVLSK